MCLVTFHTISQVMERLRRCLRRDRYLNFLPLALLGLLSDIPLLSCVLLQSLPIARKKIPLDSITAALEPFGEDDEVVSRKRAHSVQAQAPPTFSPIPGLRNQIMPSGQKANSEAVPFLNLKKMASRDDSKYLTLTGSEFFPSTYNSPEGKLHQVCFTIKVHCRPQMLTIAAVVSVPWYGDC